MNKIFSFVLGCLIIATLLAGVFSPALPGVLAGGRPEEECPPQGNSGVTCDWVQHRVTGQCKWIPSHSLHWPWEKVEEGTCPDLEQKEPTPTLPAPTAPAPTDKPDPTAQPDPTEVPSTSGDPTATPSGDDGFFPTCTPTPTAFATGENLEACDLCLELRRIADAAERQAAAQETMAAKP